MTQYPLFPRNTLTPVPRNKVARYTNEWRAKGETGEAQRLLRRLQAIRVGTLKIAGQDSKRLLTQIPPELNALLCRASIFRGNGAGSAAHYFVGTGAWGTG